MSEQNKRLSQPETFDYPNDIVRMLQILFKRRILIILGIFLSTVISICISLLLPRTYKSEAFFQLSATTKEQSVADEKLFDLMKQFDIFETSDLFLLPDTKLSLHEYKKHLALFTNPKRFIHFLEEKEFFEEQELEHIKGSIRGPDDLTKWILPIFSYSKDDLKEMARITSEEENFILGVNLVYEDNSAEKARKFVQILGEYIRECIIFGKLYEYINDKQSNSSVKLNKYENLIIKTNFNLEQLLKKRKEIQSIYSQYPQASKIDTRQVVSVSGEAYRYLAPIYQLVGIESNIVDIKAYLPNFNREKTKAEINFEFFSEIKKDLQESVSGVKIFQKLVELRDKQFTDQVLSQDSAKEVYHQISMDIENFRAIFFENMGFRLGPTLPTAPVKPRKKVIIAAGFFIGVFVFIFLAFVVEFWKKNKVTITKQ